MTLTGKQKRYLRSLMVTETAVIQIGKGSISDALVLQTKETLLAREVIKIKVQNNNDEDLEQLATELAEACDAHLVQIMVEILSYIVEIARNQKSCFPNNVFLKGSLRCTNKMKSGWSLCCASH